MSLLAEDCLGDAIWCVGKFKRGCVMEKEAIKDKLKEIFINVFKLDDEGFNEADATMDSIDEWDSLSHVTLVLQIQKDFNCNISQADVVKFDSFAGIVDYLGSSLQ